MSTLSVIHPTLLDVTKRLDPNGKIDAIAELLNLTNDLQDAVWIEGNLPTGHRTTVRTGLPVPTWRKLYGGVQPTKSQTVQVTDACGMLEMYAEVDKALADLNGNTSEFRLSESRPHLEGMMQEFASTLFYGNEGTEPEAFTGIAARFNSLSAQNADNIINASGSGSDNTSIYGIQWSSETVHCIYPKGSKAGLTHEDKGQVTVENIDGSSGRAEMYRDHFRWDCGVSVRDWRSIVRIANIDLSDLTKTGSTGADLFDLLAQAIELFPNVKTGRTVFYANRKIRSFLRRQARNAIVNSTLTWDMVAGRRVLAIDGVPIERCDAIVNTETVVA